MAATMQHLLNSSLGLLSPDMDSPIGSMRASKGNNPAAPLDLAACFAVGPALDAALLPDAALLRAPGRLFDDSDHQDDWGFLDTAIKELDPNGHISLCKIPNRTSRLPTFASLLAHGEGLNPGPHGAALRPAEGPPPAPGRDGFGAPKGLPARRLSPPPLACAALPPQPPFRPRQFSNGGGNAPSNATLQSPRSEPLTELEKRATQIIVEYLSDPNINPYKGSVPLERIQNIFRGKHGDLYQQVVGSKHSAWKKYIQRNADTFEQFSVEEGKWRMRLLCHTDWREGDEKEEAARLAWETHFTEILAGYLEAMATRTSSLDAFMAAYPKMPQNQPSEGEEPLYALPHRGDLVRFIRRSARFDYDQANFLISFRRDQGPDAKSSLVSPRPKAEREQWSRVLLGDKGKEDARTVTPNSNGRRSDPGSAPFFDAMYGMTEPPELPSPHSGDHAFYIGGPFPPPFYHPPFYGAPLMPLAPFPMAFAPPLMAFTAAPEPAPAVPPLGPAAPSPGGPSPTPEADARAAQTVAEYLLDPTINPYHGSVPVERIQNLFRSRNPELYDEVVGNKHSAWKRYIERHSDLFSIFPIEEGKWRMRLLCHEDWQAGDRREEAAREAWEAFFTGLLARYLQARPAAASTLDEFIAAYPALAATEPASMAAGEGAEAYPLPHRGDLVRFLRRSPAFNYDQSSFLITLKKPKETERPEKKSPTAAKPKGATKLNPHAPCFRPKADPTIDG